MKKTLLSLTTSAFILTGCAGKTAMPVPQIQPQDNYMTCSNIALEMQDNQTKFLKLVGAENKTGKNVGLGVAGAFLIVPWFFMDFSDAERVEAQALELRNNRLRVLAETKNCNEPLPAPIKLEPKKEEQTDKK